MFCLNIINLLCVRFIFVFHILHEEIFVNKFFDPNVDWEGGGLDIGVMMYVQFICMT